MEYFDEDQPRLLGASEVDAAVLPRLLGASEVDAAVLS